MNLKIDPNWLLRMSENDDGFYSVGGLYLEDRWKHPDACDLCGKVTSCPENEHIYPPDMTFVWCNDCRQNSAVCQAKISEAITEYRNHIRLMKLNDNN